MTELKTRKSVGRAFSSAAEHYVENATLQVQVGEWLLESLNYAPDYLDVGCGAGYMAEQLLSRDLAEQVVGLDCAWQMLGQQPATRRLVCADMASPPFAPDSFGQITSNLALQWAAEPAQALNALLPLLKPGGSFSFTVPAPGSLVELSQSWQAAGDAHQHVNKFGSAEEWRAYSLSALKQLDLQGEVTVEQRKFVRWFESPRAAIQSLMDVGANRVSAGARLGLTGNS